MELLKVGRSNGEWKKHRGSGRVWRKLRWKLLVVVNEVMQALKEVSPTFKRESLAS